MRRACDNFCRHMHHLSAAACDYLSSRWRTREIDGIAYHRRSHPIRGPAAPRSPLSAARSLFCASHRAGFSATEIIFQETNSAHKEADGRPFKNYSAPLDKEIPQQQQQRTRRLLILARCFPKPQSKLGDIMQQQSL